MFIHLKEHAIKQIHGKSHVQPKLQQPCTRCGKSNHTTPHQDANSKKLIVTLVERRTTLLPHSKNTFVIVTDLKYVDSTSIYLTMPTYS